MLSNGSRLSNGTGIFSNSGLNTTDFGFPNNEDPNAHLFNKMGSLSTDSVTTRMLRTSTGHESSAFVTSVMAANGSESITKNHTVPFDPGYLPVMGLPGTDFYLIHICAIASLVTSICFSAGTMTYLTRSRRLPFFRRTIGERLTIYLAVIDVLFGTIHLIDHLFMLITKQHVPDIPCSIFGFLLVTLITAQALMVMVVAILAFIMVVWEKRINFGKYDWRILSFASGIPLAAAIVLVSAGWLGPQGAW